MRNRTKITTIVGIAVLAFFVLQLTGLFRPINEAMRWMFLPVARVLSSAGSSVGSAFRSDPEKAVLRDRVSELEARLQTVTVDYVRLKELEEENRSLKALATFVNGSGYDAVPARVIARSQDPDSAVVTIDRGTNDGIELGMAVVVGQGVFVGKITSISERIATVTLVSDVTSRVAAASAGGARLYGIVEGRGNDAARLTLVPQHEPLAKDDIVVTAGTEEKIPANLTIGLVNSVEEKATDPFKQAAIEPLAKANRLDLLLILRSTALRPSSASHP